MLPRKKNTISESNNKIENIKTPKQNIIGGSQSFQDTQNLQSIQNTQNTQNLVQSIQKTQTPQKPIEKKEPFMTQEKITTIYQPIQINKTNKTIIINNTTITINEILKFITKNISSTFLQQVSSTNFLLIEKNICIFDENGEIIFIGENFFDIENLVKFYSMFYIYEMNELKNDLENIETNEEKKNIISIINNFIFSVIEKTMKKLKEISETPQINDNTIREAILNYSIAIVYKYSENIHRQLKENKEEIKLLNDNLNLIKQKCILSEKDKLINTKPEQTNTKIEQINTETEFNGGSIGITELANELEKLDTENDIENTNTLSEILNYMFSKKNKKQ